VIDGEAERELLASHDVIVFQHPVHWYSAPPLMRQWQDTVLTYGWAFTFDGTLSQLAGKKALVSVTTGVPAESHTPEGANRATLETLLSSWQATLRLCQFDSQGMIAIYGADTPPEISDSGLAAASERFVELLASL
jgi:glutathione-regulated potassium-efflux system ancillary protein KefG